MRALITIIILGLIVWAIWWFVRGDKTNVPNTPATGGSAIDIGNNGTDNTTATSTDNTGTDGTGEYQDKG